MEVMSAITIFGSGYLECPYAIGNPDPVSLAPPYLPKISSLKLGPARRWRRV